MRSTLTGNKNLDIDILNQLDDRDLVSFCRTSKYANQLCNDQILWQRRTIDRFRFIPLDVMKKYKGDREWSDFYIELSQKARIKSNKQYFLNESSKEGRLDLVILALKQGANIHEDNDWALVLASMEGHLDIVKYLVSQGGDIHVSNDVSLRVASRYGHLEIVKYLVSKGADIHAFNDQALKWSRFYGHTDVVKFLEEQMNK